jgi:hypothetical protein
LKTSRKMTARTGRTTTSRPPSTPSFLTTAHWISVHLVIPSQRKKHSPLLIHVIFIRIPTHALCIFMP